MLVACVKLLPPGASRRASRHPSFTAHLEVPVQRRRRRRALVEQRLHGGVRARAGATAVGGNRLGQAGAAGAHAQRGAGRAALSRDEDECEEGRLAR
mgnify:CR=1 FL=1